MQTSFLACSAPSARQCLILSFWNCFFFFVRMQVTREVKILNMPVKQYYELGIRFVDNTTNELRKDDEGVGLSRYEGWRVAEFNGKKTPDWQGVMRAYDYWKPNPNDIVILKVAKVIIFHPQVNCLISFKYGAKHI